MRQDDFSPSPSSLTTPDPRRSSRVRAWIWPLVLVALTALTSLALAVMVSAWLVPLYLILMAWILAPFGGSRDHAPASIEAGSESVSDSDTDRDPSVEPAMPGAVIRSRDESSAGEVAVAEEGSLDQVVVNAPEPVAVKTRRGKGRGRKAKGGTNVEPAVAAATWIQVGPGKFVRVEGPSTSESATTEPSLAEATAEVVVSEGESVDPQASAQPAAEGTEEPLLQGLVPERELAVEVGPEPENRPATFEATAADDEPDPSEPIVDNARSSSLDVDVDSTAEALPQPMSPASPEQEAALPHEELVTEGLAVEAGLESAENRFATQEAPAPCDELEQDELIADHPLSSPVVEAEAWPGSSSLPVEEETAWLEEEPVPSELAVEVGPEPEEPFAIPGESTPVDESSQDETLAANALLSSDVAEAWSQPSFSEEDALSEPDVSYDEFENEDHDTEETQEPDFRELVTERDPASDDRLATVDASAAGDDDSIPEELSPEAVAEAGSEFPSFETAEALLPGSSEGGETPVSDGSAEAEWPTDGTWLNEGTCEDATVLSNEAVAEFEEESDGPTADATVESSLSFVAGDDLGAGPVEPSGDQGIALDAPAVDWNTGSEDRSLDAMRDAYSPSLCSISSPSRSPGKVTLDSGRRFWPRAGLTLGRTAGSRSSGRAVRYGSKVRSVSGPRRRLRRGSGASYRLACRTFPPRSPPVRGEIGRAK